jgi:hypothetical protein
MVNEEAQQGFFSFVAPTAYNTNNLGGSAMSTEQIGDTLADRWAQLKQQKQPDLATTVKVYEPSEKLHILIRPNAPSWEALERELQDVTVIAKPLIWITIKKLFEQGYGAELMTLAEMVREIHTKPNPSRLFIKMISKASGNWERTKEKVHETWEVRRNALEVIDKLKLEVGSTKAILKLAWRLKNTIIHYLGLATEQGTGIKNPAGVFFALTMKPKPATT